MAKHVQIPAGITAGQTLVYDDVGDTMGAATPGGATDNGNVLGGTANDPTSIVAGAATSGGRNRDVVIGVGAEAPTSYPSDDNVAIGYQAKAPYLNGVAIGRGANSGVGNFNVAVGRNATCGNSGSETAVGYGASANGPQATAFGESATALADGLAVGKSASSSAQGVAIGRSASVATGIIASTDAGTALGRAANCTHVRSIAFANTSTTAADQVMVGPRHLELGAVTTPVAPAAGSARLAFRANAGAQELVLILPSGEIRSLDGAVLSASVQAASYQLAIANLGAVVETDVAVANDVTIPANATVNMPVGAVIEVCQIGAGQTTIVAAGGVTLRIPGGATAKLRGQWSTVSLRQRAVDEWVLTGDLEAVA